MFLIKLILVLISVNSAFATTEKIDPIERVIGVLKKDSGLSGVLYVRWNSIETNASFGMAHSPSLEIPTQEHTFKIGSLTKMFTGKVIYDLISSGQLSELDPISKFFSDWPTEEFEYEKRPVLIKHLLEHTSGIPDLKVFSNMWGRENPLGYFLSLQKLSGVRSIPGSNFAYSNYNYYLLGQIIQQITGKPYLDVLNEKFFIPLGMRSAGVVPNQSWPEAVGHLMFQGKLVASQDYLKPLYPNPYNWTSGSDGSLSMNLVDFKKWINFLQKSPLVDKGFGEEVLPHGKKLYRWGITKLGEMPHNTYWHNGGLPGVGFNSDFIFDRNGNLIVFLGNFEAIKGANISRKIYKALSTPDFDLSKPVYISPQTSENELFLYLSSIRFDLIIYILYIFIFWSRRYDVDISHSFIAVFMLLFLLLSFSGYSTEWLVLLIIAALVSGGIYVSRITRAEKISEIHSDKSKIFMMKIQIFIMFLSACYFMLRK